MDYLKALSEFKAGSVQEMADQKTIISFIEKNSDDVLYRKNKMAHLTSSALIFNMPMDKLLMIHHNIYQSWSWTGGHADGDEDLLAVAIREAKEEAGLKTIQASSDKIVSLDILPVFGHLKNNEWVSAHLHLSVAYVLLASENDSLRVKPDENSGVRWIPIGELSDYVSEPHMLVVYNKILKKVKGIKGTNPGNI